VEPLEYPHGEFDAPAPGAVPRGPNRIRRYSDPEPAVFRERGCEKRTPCAPLVHHARRPATWAKAGASFASLRIFCAHPTRAILMPAAACVATLP